MPEIITRKMLEIATNKDTGKGHYVLKSAVSGKYLTTTAETLCGLVKQGRANKVLRIVSPATVNCTRCKQAFAKHEERRMSTLKLKKVQMLKTSDGKIFPLAKRKEALVHEDSLTEKKKESEFITALEGKFFVNDDGSLDEDAVKAFEGVITSALDDHFNVNEHFNNFDTISLREFASFMYDILFEYGAKIRLMVILYQKLNGTLVPCRNTMVKMKDVGIYL